MDPVCHFSYIFPFSPCISAIVARCIIVPPSSLSHPNTPPYPRVCCLLIFIPVPSLRPPFCLLLRSTTEANGCWVLFNWVFLFWLGRCHFCSGRTVVFHCLMPPMFWFRIPIFSGQLHLFQFCDAIFCLSGGTTFFLFRGASFRFKKAPHFLFLLNHIVK